MRKLNVAIAAGVLLWTGAAGAQGTPLETEDQKTLYALGVAVSANLASFDLTEEEVKIVQEGVADGALGKKPKIDVAPYRTKFQELAKSRNEAAAKREKEASKEFLAKASKESGVTQTDSGLIYKETQAGTGASPKATDRVTVHYHGTLRDGTVFDSSKDRGQPATFPLGGVIPCWTEGVQKMKVGGKAQLICPSEIAYGDRGAPPKIKPGSTLIFDVELIEIQEQKPKAAPGAPGGAPGAAGAAGAAKNPAAPGGAAAGGAAAGGAAAGGAGTGGAAAGGAAGAAKNPH